MIERPRQVVAAYAADPENATAWYSNIKKVEWNSGPQLPEGARVAFTATYTWQDAPGNATRMQLRNRGNPSGFSALAAPLLAGQMRKANEADLRALKRILESGQAE